MKDNFKKRLFISISISSAIVFVIVILIILIGVDINNKSAFISKTRSDLNSRLNITSQLSQLRVMATEAEGPILKLDQYLPTRDVILFVPSDIQDIARRYSLGFVFRFTGIDAVVSDNVMNTSFEMNIQGDYEDIIGFIKEVENMPYFINFIDVSLITQSAGGYGATIQGIIYYRSESN